MKAHIAHRRFWRCVWQLNNTLPNRARRKRLHRLATHYGRRYRNGVLSQISLSKTSVR